ncbi:MAG: biopolymer transporter ExbD [Planctomycetaceae bacterium]|nr:biopolymer transporter ExbD [Planctomycetaceae bacterium]
MAVKINKGTAISTLSLTPLIDVVFLLLIFFLVATRFAQEDREIDVPLPDASEAMPLTIAPKELFINIDQDGKFLVNGQTLEADELEEVLVRAVTNNPVNQSVVIRSHKRAAVEYTVTAINLCKRAGIRDYMMNTIGEGG